MEPQLFQSRLLDWFDRHGRTDLPWQQNKSPYRVWVSEIMLQQTQVVTALPYFKRFLKRFPDVPSLAAGHIDEVLYHWSGLGYYSRARNLHKAAEQISRMHHFPNSMDQLLDLPGIGRSTAGAILAIAFNQRQAILDGNVKRVLSRVDAVHGWPGQSSISRELWRLSEKYTPQARVADYTQAIMDLGATLCTRSKPDCQACPFQDGCKAWLQNRTAELPTPRPKKSLPVKNAIMLIIIGQDKQILLQQKPPTGLWGGLWCLPEFDRLELAYTWCDRFPMEINSSEKLPVRRHTFSHFHLDYMPVTLHVDYPAINVLDGTRGVWYKKDGISKLALPAPVRQLLNDYRHTTRN